MSSTFTIRLAVPEDANRIHELHTSSVKALCQTHYSPEQITEWLKNRRAVMPGRLLQSTVLSIPFSRQSVTHPGHHTCRAWRKFVRWRLVVPAGRKRDVNTFQKKVWENIDENRHFASRSRAKERYGSYQGFCPDGG